MNVITTPGLWASGAIRDSNGNPILSQPSAPAPAPIWSFDPNKSNPAYYSGMTVNDWTLGPANMGNGPKSGYPNTVSWQWIDDIVNYVTGNGETIFDYRPTSLGQLSYVTGNDPTSYAAANRYAQGLSGNAAKAFQAGFIDPSQLSEAARASLSYGADWLNTGRYDWQKMVQANIAANSAQFGLSGIPAGSQMSALPYTQSDFDIIRAGTDKIVDQDRLYYADMLRRIQDGSIDIQVPEGPSFFEKALLAAPAIAGAMSGIPLFGALGGLTSGGITGGMQGALTGALTGGIAGNGGIGNTLSDVGGLFGGSTGGFMNTITSAINGIGNSAWNPYNWNIFPESGMFGGTLGGLVQNTFGTGAGGLALDDFLSTALPGALAGGALDGWDGALTGGLAGGLLGLGAGGNLGGALNSIFGTGGSGGTGSGGAAGGGLFGGNGLGGLFGGGGGGNSLLGLLGGAGMLKLLTNEASKVSDTPTGIRTPFSSVNQGFANIDPAIRSAFTGNIANQQGLFNQAGGNQGAYIQARVNPMLQQVAQRRGELERSMGLRGVRGSSFGDQSLTNFDIDTQRALGDARALATNDAIGMQSGLSQAMGAGGDQLFRSELGGLQLADQNIQNLLARAKIRSDIFGRAAAGAAGLLGA